MVPWPDAPALRREKDRKAYGLSVALDGVELECGYGLTQRATAALRFVVGAED